MWVAMLPTQPVPTMRTFRLDVADHVENGVAGLDVATRGAQVNRDRIIRLERQAQQLLRRPLGEFLADLAKQGQRAVLEQRAFQQIELFGGFGQVLLGVQVLHGGSSNGTGLRYGEGIPAACALD